MSSSSICNLNFSNSLDPLGRLQSYSKFLSFLCHAPPPPQWDQSSELMNKEKPVTGEFYRTFKEEIIQPYTTLDKYSGEENTLLRIL